jgi:hypothetical protein
MSRSAACQPLLGHAILLTSSGGTSLARARIEEEKELVMRKPVFSMVLVLPVVGACWSTEACKLSVPPFTGPTS